MDVSTQEGFDMLFIWIIGIVILVAAIWIIRKFIMNRDPQGYSENDTANAILNERFAKRKIDKNKYRR
ncbi:hypothetical protein [Leptospira sp. GIMC2001]|uniref:hypothetical protein n=1 Tax=Leptospira sp. GIMC2001 TaxID=1513297 RepID=UPI0023498EC3|nr:hypothetical protein [Leptospira sp. GIMC2001]WCL50279.1 hypothetical protein O4O04_05510 [Leptospira sp. GIMC2001]